MTLPTPDTKAVMLSLFVDIDYWTRRLGTVVEISEQIGILVKVFTENGHTYGLLKDRFDGGKR